MIAPPRVLALVSCVLFSGCSQGETATPSSSALAPPLMVARACTACHEPGGPHAAHVGASPSNATGLPCSTCHPDPSDPSTWPLHGDGIVEVLFDPARVPGEAHYDAKTRACAVECHDRGGARPKPSWNDTTPIVCGDCHRSPPAAHLAGPCTECHSEADATGTSLIGGPLHMNGRVDLGNGSGRCGACHGDGNDPWPRTGAHVAHEDASLSNPIACEDCHVIPAEVHAAGHLGVVAKVTFSRLAIARGSTPTWDGRTCSSVACHGASLVDAPAVVPAWRDSSSDASTCGACHGLPPSNHAPTTSCSTSACHGGEVTMSASGVLSITEEGSSLHINGVVDHGP